MKNKGLVIALIVLAGVLLMFLVTIFLFTLPESNISKNKNVVSETSVITEIEDYVEETYSPQEMGYSIEHYKYDDGMNIDIEYPQIYGMENMLYQENLNKKLNINATSILLLHEDKEKIKSLNVTCTVEEFDDKKMTVLYEGEMFFSDSIKKLNPVKKTSDNEMENNLSSTPKKKSTSKPKNNTSNVDPNYDSYGGGVNFSNNTSNYNDYQPPIQQTPQSSNYDNYAPITNQNGAINMAPGMSPINGFASTKVSSKKIFWTSCVNMEECKDFYMTESINTNEIISYLYGNDIYIENADELKTKNIKNYIKKIKKSNVEKMINEADFQNVGLSSWPQMFSYIKNDYLYFSLPVSHELGDYVIVKYNLYSK